MLEHFTCLVVIVDEGHEGDWRECTTCNKADTGGARPFLSTNGFCQTPCLEKFIPRGSMITFPCDRQGCNNRMIPGHCEMISVTTRRGIFCETCSEELY